MKEDNIFNINNYEDDIIINDSIINIIKDTDKKDFFETYPVTYGNFDEKIKDIIQQELQSKEKSILGIDIYQYSQYKSDQQKLIPIIFDLIIEEARRWCHKFESLFFSNYLFRNNFIHTGDGGFQIFDNPLQALVFNINFYSILRLYNSGHFYPKMRKFIGELILRSCITIGEIYPYHNNYFGEGIINNARILSKDKLNRFIIDNNTYEWFLQKINGIESINILDNDTIIKILNISKYKTYISSIFGNKQSKNELNNTKDSKERYCKVIKRSYIKDCHVQKIGEVKIKKQDLSIYNIEIQRLVCTADENDTSKQIDYIVTIGNLSSVGITNDS